MTRPLAAAIAAATALVGAWFVGGLFIADHFANGGYEIAIDTITRSSRS